MIRVIWAGLVERAINPVLGLWGLEADVYPKSRKPGVWHQIGPGHFVIYDEVPQPCQEAG